MKKLPLLLLFLTGVAVAEPGTLICREVPPGCEISHIGGRAVIHDARGFFVGYFRPAPPPPQVLFVPAGAPRRGLWVPRSRAMFGGASDFFGGGLDSGDGYTGPDVGCSSSTSSSSAPNDYADSCVSPLASPSHGF
jgi:hypothetical protein